MIFFLMILPFLGHGFGYWFNHGQPPHSSRVSPFDIAAEFFGSSQWIKFYLFLIVLLAVMRYRNIKALRADRRVRCCCCWSSGYWGKRRYCR